MDVRRPASVSWPGAKRHRFEPLAYVCTLLTALPSNAVDLETLLSDVWIAAHPEHFLTYSREEAEAAAFARRRRRDRRPAQAPGHGRSPLHGRDVVRPAMEELAHRAQRSWGVHRSLAAPALDVVGQEGCPRPLCCFAQRLTLTFNQPGCGALRSRRVLPANRYKPCSQAAVARTHATTRVVSRQRDTNRE